MKIKSLLSPTKIRKYSPFLLATLGSLLLLISAHRFDIGISPDSVGYIRVARNLARASGLVIQNHQPLITQPPLYPILLALSGMITNKDPLATAKAVNAFLFGLILLSGSRLFSKHLSSLALIIAAPFFLLFSPVLFNVSRMAWTEPLFIALTLMVFHSFQSYRESKRTKSLILSAVLTSLSTLTRYMGLTLILWGAIVIFFLNDDQPQQRARHLTLFFLLSGIPLGGWLIRNYLLSGTLFGGRAPASFTFSQNLFFVFRTLRNWYLPDLKLFGIFALVFGVGLASSSQFKERWRDFYKNLHQSSSLILFVVLYTASLVFSSSITAFDQIGDRLLSPIYIPLTLVLFIFFEGLIGSLRKYIPGKATQFVVLTFLAVGLISPVWKTLSAAKDHYQNGEGYHSKLWVQSKTIKYLHQHEELRTMCTFYTNAPDALYILANLKAEMSPMKRRYNSPQKIQDIQDLKGTWPQTQNGCLIWFEHAGRPYLFSLAELREAANLQEIEAFRNGAIYSVRRK